jgi:hypothetical protein
MTPIIAGPRNGGQAIFPQCMSFISFIPFIPFPNKAVRIMQFETLDPESHSQG